MALLFVSFCYITVRVLIFFVKYIYPCFLVPGCGVSSAKRTPTKTFNDTLYYSWMLAVSLSDRRRKLEMTTDRVVLF
jgi:hypothetical protein